MIKNHPDLTNGNPYVWLDILAKVKALEPCRLIPGHGKLGTLEDMTMMRRYITSLLYMAEQNASTGTITPTSKPPAFTARWDNAEAYEKNLEFPRSL